MGIKHVSVMSKSLCLEISSAVGFIIRLHGSPIVAAATLQNSFCGLM